MECACTLLFILPGVREYAYNHFIHVSQGIDKMLYLRQLSLHKQTDAKSLPGLTCAYFTCQT
jgi:hypothetical protein